MIKRLGTAVVLVAFLLSMLFWVRQYWVGAADLVICLFGFVGTYEMFHSLKSAKKEDGERRFHLMAVPVILAMAVICPLSVYFGMDGLVISIIIAVLTSIVIMTFKREKYSLTDLFATNFILLYPLMIMSLFFKMNRGQGEVLVLLLVIAIAVLEDTMAYFVGITFKGPKLCPTISPKKTVSGAIGGVIGGMLGAVIVFLLFDYFRLFDGMKNITIFALHENWKISLPIYLAVGFIGGILGELGDLGASAIKRHLGIKDYGKIFPGHGGFMDRIDSFIFIVPLVYVLSYIMFVIV